MHHFVVDQLLPRNVQAQGRGDLWQAAKEVSVIMSSCFPRRGADLDRRAQVLPCCACLPVISHRVLCFCVVIKRGRAFCKDRLCAMQPPWQIANAAAIPSWAYIGTGVGTASMACPAFHLKYILFMVVVAPNGSRAHSLSSTVLQLTVALVHIKFLSQLHARLLSLCHKLVRFSDYHNTWYLTSRINDQISTATAGSGQQVAMVARKQHMLSCTYFAISNQPQARCHTRQA